MNTQTDPSAISNRAKKRIIGKTVKGLRAELDALRAANLAHEEAIRKNRTLDVAIQAELRARGKSYG